MAWEAVDVYVRSNPLDLPLSGVLVRVYDAAGTVQYTEGTTDTTGRAALLLPVGSFTVRFYRFGTRFVQPQLMTIAAQALNSPPYTFDFVGEVMGQPAATDARLCRCSGYFRELNGGPKKYLDLSFSAEFDPILLEGAGVVSGGIRVRTDENGWVELDLIRGGIYNANVESMEATPTRCVRVPDLASANLPDLLFPVVSDVQLDVGAPLSVPVGGQLVVTPTVLASSGVPLMGTASDDVNWTVADTSIASVAIGAEQLTISGLVAGSTYLVATRKDTTIIRIPEPGLPTFALVVA